MNDNPFGILVLIIAGVYLFRLWWGDMRASQVGAQNKRALPGAFPTDVRPCLIAAAGAFVILGIEIVGEFALGIWSAQSSITALFALYSLIAAFIEEVIFRGFIVFKGGWRWPGAFAASLVFALFHEFLWHWDEEGFALTLTLKGFFSTLMVFILSMWFYFVRFSKFNRTGSLLPCIVGHAVKNLGVIVAKGLGGFWVGWW